MLATGGICRQIGTKPWRLIAGIAAQLIGGMLQAGAAIVRLGSSTVLVLDVDKICNKRKMDLHLLCGI